MELYFINRSPRVIRLIILIFIRNQKFFIFEWHKGNEWLFEECWGRVEFKCQDVSAFDSILLWFYVLSTKNI